MTFRNLLAPLFGLLLSAALGGCTSMQPQRQPTALGMAQTNSWEEHFTQTPQIDDFRVLTTGRVQVPRSGMLDPKSTPDTAPFGETMWVEVYAFLIHHRQRGWFLLDTGLDSSYQQDGNIGGPIARRYILNCEQAPGQNIRAQLHSLQLLDSLQGIFITHLHGDHTAGFPELPHGVPVYVGQEEKYLYYPLLYTPNHLNSTYTLHELPPGTKRPYFQGVWDVFADGSLLALATPGHSPAHRSYLLHTTNGPVLLTGDASHTRYGFEQGIAPGWVHDRAAAQRSLEGLREFTAQFPEVTVIFGHQR